MVHPNPTWLKTARKKRRTLKDIHNYLTEKEIYDLIMNGKLWPYKTQQRFYELRDHALAASLYLIGCRVSELRQLHKPFDFNSDPDFIIIKDFEISKRKQQTIAREGIPKIDVPLPKTGRFSKFTELILNYYDIAPEQLFNLSRTRTLQIVKYMTGKWCHYFRSQRISYMVNLFHSALITSKIIGVKNPQTLSHYYKTAWQEHREKLKI